MGFESEATNQMFGFTLNGMALAIEVTGKLTTQLIHYFAAIIKYCKNKGVALLDEHGHINHEIPLARIMARGNGVQSFDIKESDVETFRAAAKNTPMYYSLGSVDMTSKNGERMMTIFVGPDDVPFVNKIIEHNNISIVKTGEASVKSVDPEIAKNMPPVPEPKKSETEERETTWANFVGPDNEVDTPETNKAKSEAANNVRPTQPVSEAKTESQSVASSGPLDQETTTSTVSPPDGEQTVINENIDEQNRVRERARVASENEKFNIPATDEKSKDFASSGTEVEESISAQKHQPLIDDLSGKEEKVVNLKGQKPELKPIRQQLADIKASRQDIPDPQKALNTAKQAEKMVK